MTSMGSPVLPQGGYQSLGGTVYTGIINLLILIAQASKLSNLLYSLQ